jgi:surface protein
MKGMFSHSGFNGDISNWNVSNVTNMKAMFWKSKFNSDISSWNISNVMDAQAMFMETEFNQDISNWHFNDNAIISDMFMACPIKNEYKPKMIRMNEAFDFNSINDTRSKDALKTIEKLQHEQDFIDVPKIKGPELTKLKGFVAGM